MKKTKITSIFSVMFLILIILGAGCKKDPDPVVVVKPTAELYITPSSDEVIPYGTKCIISWNSNSPYCILNDKFVSPTGSITINQLLRDTVFYLKAQSGDLSDSIMKSLKVGDWTASNFGLLTHSPWSMKALRCLQNGEVAADLILFQEQKTNLFYFYPSGESKIITSSGGTAGNGSWAFSENETHIIMGGSYSIKSLTEKEFIIDIESDYNHKPAIFEQVYYRP